MRLVRFTFALLTFMGVLGVILSTGCSASPGDTPKEDCGQDVVELYVQGDTGVRALYEQSEPEFNARWLSRVRCLAKQGDAEAQLQLGIAYRDGSGGPPQNYSEAAAWFRRAAEQANAMAQLNLGQLYEHGRGVPQDYVQAHMWYNLAVTGFDWREEPRRRAFESREGVAQRMSPREIAEAQRLAREWWEKVNQRSHD